MILTVPLGTYQKVSQFRYENNLKWVIFHILKYCYFKILRSFYELHKIFSLGQTKHDKLKRLILFPSSFSFLFYNPNLPLQKEWSKRFSKTFLMETTLCETAHQSICYKMLFPWKLSIRHNTLYQTCCIYDARSRISPILFLL